MCVRSLLTFALAFVSRDAQPPPKVDVEAAIQKDNQLLGKLAALERAVQDGGRGDAAARATVTRSPASAKALQRAGTYTQDELRDFFVLGKRPRAMDDATAQLLKEHYAVFTILEGPDGALLGVWPQASAKDPSPQQPPQQP